MQHNTTIYELTKKALRFASNLRAVPSGLPQVHDYGFDGMRCCLCRMRQKGPRSFAADRARCKSCRMTKRGLRWLFIGDGCVERWRGAMSQREFAKLFGVSSQRMSVLERSTKINAASAEQLARTLVLGEPLGTDLGAVSRDWPLFYTLLPAGMVYGAADGQVPRDMG